MTWSFGGFGKLLPPDERVDERRLADIGATNEGKLRKVTFRAILHVDAALYKLSMLDMSWCGGSSHEDIGARKASEANDRSSPRGQKHIIFYSCQVMLLLLLLVVK